jgi:hypothetical protein
VDKTINTLKYDHYAVELPDGKYVGPYKTWAHAELAKSHNSGKYIVKCTGIGELQPFMRSDGTLVDLGTIPNPKPLDLSAPLTFTRKESTMTKNDDTAGKPIYTAQPEAERTSGHVTYTAAHTQVDKDAEERVKRHQAHVEKFGIAMAPPLYAPGFVTEKLGGDNFHISHTEHKAMPRTLDGLAGIREAVKEERRRDLVLHPQRLRMASNGLLYREDGAKNADGSPKTIVLEDNGLRQLCARLNDQFPRAADFLKVLDPADRAEAFNKQIVKVDPEFEIKARTRTPIGSMPSVYAMVGKTYSAFDADRIAEVLSDPFRDLEKEFGDENAPRGMAMYRPDDSSMRVDAIWHADSIVNLAAGDVFKAGLRFRSSDSGGGSIKADLLVWRNLCKNLIIIDKKSVEVLRRTHRGSMDGIVVDLTAATERAKEFLSGFAKDWGYLRAAPISKVEIYGETYSTVPEALRALVDQGRIDGMTANAAAVEALLSGWSKEPGNTLADIINAVTRAAHETKFGLDKQEKIEKAAGELVPVLVRSAQRAFA